MIPVDLSGCYCIRVDEQRPAIQITRQGSLVSVRWIKPPKRICCLKRRGPIVGFSDKARLRCLKRVAVIDWDRLEDGLFVTLTYPDSHVNLTIRQRTIQRSRFYRFLELFFLRRIPSVWRIEWKERKTGSHVGELHPHMHLMVFGCPPLHKEIVWREWASIIGHNGWCSTDVQVIERGKMAALYVSKYAAKEESHQLLDNVPYLNKTGRHAGWTRQRMIPQHGKGSAVTLDPDTMVAVMQHGSDLLPWVKPNDEWGYCVLGKDCDEITERFLEMGIDVRVKV